MQDIAWALSELTTHSSNVRAIGKQVDAIAKKGKSLGIGGDMFGKLHSWYLVPVLEKATGSQSDAIAELGTFLDKRATALDEAQKAYSAVESDNVAAAQQVTATLGVK